MATDRESHAQSQNVYFDSNTNRSANDFRGGDIDGVNRHHDGHPIPSPFARSSAASIEMPGATPPINIPAMNDGAFTSDSPGSGDESFMDRYMRGRKTSISFNEKITTDTGHQQSIDDPLEKPTKTRARGRSMMDALAEARAHRSQSESTRDHFDLVTGRHLPKFATSPPREQPHVGEARFPLLQQTVDEMARESQTDLSLKDPHPDAVRIERVRSPGDGQSSQQIPPLEIPISSHTIAASYDSPRPFRRTASERWKNGDTSQDFFSQARSSRRTTGSWRSLRRDTNSSFKSPSSAASSFLRGFSLGSGGDESNASTSADAEGQTIGEDYVLGKQIGFGGFSIIREVTQLSAETGKQRKLAVKIVRRNIEGKPESENETAQAEFEHEVELWRFLSHPNILPLEAVYKLEEATFCFIPLNTGGTLFDVIRKNRDGIPIDLARNYTYQVASALRYLHLDARVVHRDVKLENCLLDTTSGEPGLMRMCDFGMAEWLQGDSSTSRSADNHSPRRERRSPKFIGPAASSTAAFAGGSLEYAAPEIVQRATSAQDCDSTYASRSLVSPAVDIWAMGVCLFTLIMGKRPFSDSFVPRVVMAILAGEWDKEAVAIKLGNHPEANSIMQLLEGCLEMDERQRWRIRDVVNCDWFEEERQKDNNPDSDAGRGWRL